VKIRTISTRDGKIEWRTHATQIGGLMVRYIAHITGHDVYPAARWREFISRGQT